MNWFLRIIGLLFGINLGSSSYKYIEGLSLPDSPVWEITEPKKAHKKFINSLHIILSPSSKIYIEGTSIASDVCTFLEANKTHEKQKIARSTLFPKAKIFHINASEENLKKLSSFFKNKAVPEICDHFHIYDDSDIILSWHDCFTQPFYISNNISEKKIITFCDAIGSKYSNITHGIN